MIVFIIIKYNLQWSKFTFKLHYDDPILAGRHKNRYYRRIAFFSTALYILFTIVILACFIDFTSQGVNAEYVGLFTPIILIMLFSFLVCYAFSTNNLCALVAVWSFISFWYNIAYGISISSLVILYDTGLDTILSLIVVSYYICAFCQLTVFVVSILSASNAPRDGAVVTRGVVVKDNSDRSTLEMRSNDYERGQNKSADLAQQN